MSIQAMAPVMAATVGPADVQEGGKTTRIDASARKAVLLSLANHADRWGRNAFPSVRVITQETELSERHVKRVLRSLRDQGLIRQDRPPGRRQPPTYSLDLRAISELPRWHVPDEPEYSDDDMPDEQPPSEDATAAPQEGPRGATVAPEGPREATAAPQGGPGVPQRRSGVPQWHCRGAVAASRGAAAAPEPSSEPSIEPSQEPPPLSPLPPSLPPDDVWQQVLDVMAEGQPTGRAPDILVRSRLINVGPQTALISVPASDGDDDRFWLQFVAERMGAQIRRAIESIVAHPIERLLFEANGPPLPVPRVRKQTQPEVEAAHVASPVAPGD